MVPPVLLVATVLMVPLVLLVATVLRVLNQVVFKVLKNPNPLKDVEASALLVVVVVLV